MRDQPFMHENGNMPLENNSKAPQISSYYISRMIRRENEVQSKYFRRILEELYSVENRTFRSGV